MKRLEKTEAMVDSLEKAVRVHKPQQSAQQAELKAWLADLVKERTPRKENKREDLTQLMTEYRALRLTLDD